MPDNFAREITLDSLCAEIPIGHAAVGVQQENCVVGDALHEQPELLFALPKRLFGRPAFGQVARDLGKPDDLAGGPADRIDDHGSPKARAVLADTPAFVLEFSFSNGSLKGPGRKAGFLVFLAVEPREVLTDDLSRCVALETLRARIPTGYDPRRVQHVNGIIRHRLNEEAVASFIR